MVVQAEIPGFKPEQLRVEVAGNVLTLHGERSQEQEHGAQHGGQARRSTHFHQSERSSGSFTRSLVVPSNVDPDTAEATMEHGVLTVRFRRQPGSSGRSIPIRTPTANPAQRVSDPGGGFRRPPADS